MILFTGEDRVVFREIEGLQETDASAGLFRKIRRVISEVTMRNRETNSVRVSYHYLAIDASHARNFSTGRGGSSVLTITGIW